MLIKKHWSYKISVQKSNAFWKKMGYKISFNGKIILFQKLQFEYLNCSTDLKSQSPEHFFLTWVQNNSRNQIRFLFSFDYFKMKKWYFVTKIVLTCCEKKLFYWSRKTFEMRGWRPRIWKSFEITRTIYSNSERSEQFLVTECFFELFLEIN